MTPQYLTLSAHLSLTLLLLAASGSNARTQTKPVIRFGESPALLVRIDGEPVYEPPADIVGRIRRN